MGAAVDKDDEKDDETLAAARAYTRRGWRVVPVRPGEKSVAIVRWTEMRLDEDDLPKWFRGAADNNIGILTGEPSGGLVDIDCDAPEARAAAQELLPTTRLISGRASAPASHYWYRIEGDTAEIPVTTKFGDMATTAAPSPTPPPCAGEGLPEPSPSPLWPPHSSPSARWGRVVERSKAGRGSARYNTTANHHHHAP